jgi:hypothetical protein
MIRGCPRRAGFFWIYWKAEYGKITVELFEIQEIKFQEELEVLEFPTNKLFSIKKDLIVGYRELLNPLVKKCIL